MTAVNIFTADRMKEIEDTTVVGGLVDGNGNLLLTTREGEEIDAGYVVGPPGVMGPGFNYRGAWAAATAYAVRDVVTSGGSTFVVNTAHTSSSTAPTATVPGTNLSLWAQKGSDGIIGQDGSTAIPAGTISLWGSDTAPANWMICDGTAISRTTYASLFATIGTRYGAGDGVNTFNLPNLKGRTPIGKDAAQTEFAALAQIGGEKAHLLTVAEMPAHNHIFGAGQNVPVIMSGASSYYWNAPTGPDRVNFTGGTANTGGGATHNILQPYNVVNFIIKVTNGDTPGDSQLTQRVSNLETFASASPAGTITIFGGDTAPTNWKFCDGSAVSRTTYASLFAAIGTKYGAGDGSTTFNLPNFKGRSPFGFDATQTEFNALAKTGGTKTHNHQHISPIGSASGNTYVFTPYSATLDANGKYDFDHIETVANVSGIGANGPGANEVYRVTSSDSGTLPPYLTVNYIIKVTNGDTQGDSQLTTRVSALESRTTYQTRVSDKTNALQTVMTGGGLRKCSGTGFSWSERFMLMGAGRDDITPSGFFEISMPANGTVIPVYYHATITSITVAGGIIPWATWGALYYEITPGAINTSDPTKFRVVSYTTDNSFRIPSNWILVCACNADTLSPWYTWGDGRSQDFWHNLGLQNAYYYYSGGSTAGTDYAAAGYRFTDDGKVAIRGLVGGAGANGTTIMAMPNAFMGPDNRAIFTTQASGGFARIDATYDGLVVMMNYLAGGNGGYISLEGIEWYPRGV